MAENHINSPEMKEHSLKIQIMDQPQNEIPFTQVKKLSENPLSAGSSASAETKMLARGKALAPAQGATSFLFSEYHYVGVFIIASAILIFLFLGAVGGFSTKSQPCTHNKEKMCKSAVATAIFSGVSFLLGAVIAVIPGFLGIKFVTYANARNTFEVRSFAWRTFILAFSSSVIGSLHAAINFLVLYIAICLSKLYYGDDREEGLCEAITGYLVCYYAITIRFYFLQLNRIGVRE